MELGPYLLPFYFYKAYGWYLLHTEACSSSKSLVVDTIICQKTISSLFVLRTLPFTMASFQRMEHTACELYTPNISQILCCSSKIQFKSHTSDDMKVFYLIKE